MVKRINERLTALQDFLHSLKLVNSPESYPVEFFKLLKSMREFKRIFYSFTIETVYLDRFAIKLAGIKDYKLVRLAASCLESFNIFASNMFMMLNQQLEILLKTNDVIFIEIVNSTLHSLILL